MMENILQNPGLQHIIEKRLTFLDQKSIAAFRSVNRDCRRITDCPTFYLKKLSQENSSHELIKNWKLLIQNIQDEDIEQILAVELFQMYVKRCTKLPLTLAQDMAIRGNEEGLELAMYIIENSNPLNHVETKITCIQELVAILLQCI